MSAIYALNAMPDDAELVQATRSGDEDAFAEIYDRYADRVYDFCSAVLRDPERAAAVVLDTFVLAALELYRLRDGAKLEAWLFALARDQALHPEKWARALPLETEGITESGDDDREATAIVWEATGAFDERTRVLIDLELRQRLDLAALALVLGVSRAHARVLVRRLLEQSERLLRAALIARLRVSGCRRVAALAQRGDGHPAASWYRRLEHHVAACHTCRDAYASVPDPLELLAAVPVEPAPPELRNEVLYRVYVLTASDDAGPVPDEIDGAEEAAVAGSAGEPERTSDASTGTPTGESASESRDDSLEESIEEFLTGPSPEEPSRSSAAAPAGQADDTAVEEPEESFDEAHDVNSDDSAEKLDYVDLFELAPPPVPLRRGGFPPSMYPQRRRRTLAAAAVGAGLLAAAVTFNFHGFGKTHQGLLAAGAQPAPATGPVQTTVTTPPKPLPTTTAPDRVAPFVYNLATQYACIGPRNPETEVVASVTDDRKVDKVVVVATDSASGTDVTKAMIESGGQYHAVLGPYQGESSVEWKVLASDAVGNLAANNGPRFAVSAIC